VSFVDHCSRRFRTGDDVRICRLDLKAGTVAAVRDLLDVVLDLESLVERRIEPDRALGLLEGDVRDFDGRRDQKEFGLRPSVDDRSGS
jgi:hypothetical protein